METALIGFLISVQFAAQPTPAYRIERDSVAGGGAELITVFGQAASSEAGVDGPEIPLVSVLRDTLGSSDPDAVRLRQVWILTSTRPTLLQRAASALSLVWFRAPGKQHADRVPSPVLDLASPAKSVWSHLAANSLQVLQLDGRGIPIRSSTRSYRGNFSDYRQLQIYRALGALNAVQSEPESNAVWAGDEFVDVYSRLNLADRTFGGLVREENLHKAYDKEISRRQEIRGHNWELLRQRTESNGLYFDPLALPGQAPTEALIWVARCDLEARSGRAFDRKFLGIANPWTDDRLLHWTGYSEVRYFDADNRLLPPETPGARRVELIPLALYNLDYPRAPLLLVDFRSSLTAKKRELFQHASNAILTGALGITGFGNWTFLAANESWTLFRGRHGAPTNRSERLRSYAEAREFVSVDAKLPPALRAELQHRLDHLALNPLENAVDTEARVAREQFAALMQYAQSPDGLVTRLEGDRRKELAAYTRPAGLRFAGQFFDKVPAEGTSLNAELESRREAAAQVRSLRQLLASSPRPEVVRDVDQVRQSIERLSAKPFAGPEAAELIAKVFERSNSFEIRWACLAGLRRLDVEEARNELLRLAQDPREGDFWRAASLASLQGEPDIAVAAGTGQF